MGSIGQPDSYEVYILDGATMTPLVELPASEISWQRVANSTSEGSVTVPYANGGIGCASLIGGLRAWTQLVVVIRNGVMVWDGPIINWSTDTEGTLTIGARDRSALLNKRLVTVDRLYTDVNPEYIFYVLCSDANLNNMAYDPFPWGFASTPAASTGTDREYFADRLQFLADALEDLVSSEGMFWTQILGSFIWDRTAVSYTNLATGIVETPVLSPNTILGKPAVSVDATDLATVVYMAYEGQGLRGFKNKIPYTGTTYTSKTLQYGITDGQSLADTVRAATRAAKRASAVFSAPRVTLEQIQLLPQFGSATFASDLSTLRPFSIYRADFPEEVSLIHPVVSQASLDATPQSADVVQWLRLEQLDVSVQISGGALTETVSGSFTAVATEAG